MNTFLITGADLRNKGGQSMLFITIDELRKRYPDCEILFPTNIKMDNNFKVTPVFYNYNSLYYMHGGISKIKALIKAAAKTTLGKPGSVKQTKELAKIYPKLDAVIDISGYNLSSKWNEGIHFKYMEYIRQARKYNIPVYIMPQSFGPFDYPAKKKYLIKEIQDVLPYAIKIFAREKEGYQMLLDTFHLNNVVLSTDLVLQNTDVDLNNIYRRIPEFRIPEVGIDAVGIVPNRQCFNHGDKSRNMEIYRAIIEKLIDQGKDVFIFRHSTEDLEICKEIYTIIESDHIHLLENDFSCFEYDAFVRQFDFIVCSRYHGNVHAYRNCVPSVLLGWAVKYRELAELLGQERYCFDITEKKLKVEDIVAAVEKMCSNCKAESECIRKCLAPIQKDNCFESAFGE